MDEFQAKAFEVGEEIEPDDNEPLTGEEYLQRVKWQSNRCPSVVVADIDYSKIKVTIPSKTYFTLPPSITKCKKELLPTITWEKEFLNDFSEFRQKLQYIKLNRPKNNNNNLSPQLPHINDKRYWYIFCFGSNGSNNDIKMKDINNNHNSKNNNNNNNEFENEEEEEEEEDYENCEYNEEDEEEDEEEEDEEEDEEEEEDYSTKKPTLGNKPTMDILCRLDHVLTVALVNYHIEWLEKREFTQERSYWLYMLLSLLEKPIDPDTCSNLRSCIRRLSVFRSKITNLNDPNLPSINILFTIIGKYFDQLEPTDILYL
ncbi:hypothetical protein ACTFIU_007233 [Dictyostelium citrinum]